ncbi:MAG TPA: 30S ribosomal protein S6 [Terriglobia bacterium]|nr:30S ribosomal protein S6 [Terriglobia bacterium]
MRKYELIFIVRTDLSEEDLGKLITQMEGVVTSHGGKVEKVEKMGRRRLAYRVQRQREGVYILFVIEGTGDTVKEFERRLRVNDAVIKYLSVRVDEELKRAEKAKAWRAERAARKPRPRPPASESQAPEATA